jgi:pimeloyl-ACP methyl ester carboxylesterase
MAQLRLSDGAHLSYDAHGDGPVVVLLHPGLWDRRTWDRQVETFADAGFRVLRYDARGYGGSSRLTGEPYSHVRDLRALLDAREIRHAALVGCSMGGATAIDFVLTYPDRAWALVAVAPGLSGFDSTPEEDAWWEERDGPIRAAIEAGEIERAQELRLEIWASLGTSDEAGSTIRRIAFDNIHEVTMDESAEEGIGPPAAGRLHEIEAPTLLIAAQHDPPDMRRLADQLAKGIAGARLVSIDADHVVNVRAPEAFDAAVIPFLRQHAPS